MIQSQNITVITTNKYMYFLNLTNAKPTDSAYAESVVALVGWVPMLTMSLVTVLASDNVKKGNWIIMRK